MTETGATYEWRAFRRLFVESVDELRRAVPLLASADAVGVDLEMAQRPERKPGGLQEWVQVLALIQIASDDVSLVIDPVRCADLSPLRALLGGPARKVFLGGGQDAALLQKADIPARNIVDVGEVALAVFGRREDGMAALSRRIFGLSLDKTVRRADWLVRPLNPALLAYAHRDAELTLLIYRWFQENYPDVVVIHERTDLDPILPASTPKWLQDAASRPASDVLLALSEYELDPARHADRLTSDLRTALAQSRAPRQISRLMRVAADLELSDLLSEVVPLLTSLSSVVRASAARAVGRISSQEEGVRLLEPLKQDPVEDVRKAAELAVKELKTPKAPRPSASDDPPRPSLNTETLSALQALMHELEGEGAAD